MRKKTLEEIQMEEMRKEDGGELEIRKKRRGEGRRKERR